MCTNEEFLVKFFLISTILIAICYREQLHFLKFPYFYILEKI